MSDTGTPNRADSDHHKLKSSWYQIWCFRLYFVLYTLLESYGLSILQNTGSCLPFQKRLIIKRSKKLQTNLIFPF